MTIQPTPDNEKDWAKSKAETLFGDRLMIEAALVEAHERGRKAAFLEIAKLKEQLNNRDHDIEALQRNTNRGGPHRR